MVFLRAQAEKEKDLDQQQEGFAGLKKEEAARAVLKEKEPTQSMKDFAFRALSVEKQGPVWTAYKRMMRIWTKTAKQEVEASKNVKKLHCKSLCPNHLSKN